MHNILEVYQNNMNGEKWEDLCNKIYKIRYMNYGYQVVPARYKGDYGIEGFTSTGIVTQCYYPEANYSPNELYGKLRTKVTNDLEKIKENETQLYKLGIKQITEWHFITPRYEDRRILEHLASKRKELLNKKANGEITIVSDDLKLYIKDQNDFLPEFNYLIHGLEDYKIKMPELGNINYEECDSIKKNNIEKKIRNLFESQQKSYDESDLNAVIDMYIKSYLNGLKAMNILKDISPNTYEKLIQLENSYKNDIEIKCMTTLDKSLSYNIFFEILKDFEGKLKSHIGNIVTDDFISEIKHQLIGKWLADCPLNFK